MIGSPIARMVLEGRSELVILRPPALVQGRGPGGGRTGAGMRTGRTRAGGFRPAPALRPASQWPAPPE